MNDTGQHIDLELIHLVKNGDAHAYESLVRRHYDMVYSLAFHWLKSKEAAEDLTQDLFIKLSQKLSLFNERSSFKTWFYRVVINMIKDYLKKIKRENQKLPEIAAVTEHMTNDHHELLSAIEELPADISQTILLVYTQGLNHAEAAKILHCAESTVSWRIHEGKKQLKEILK